MLAHALSRTLLLMRDELVADVPDDVLLNALTSTEVILAADCRNLKSYSAQTAYTAAALLMARSGHRVHLIAPDVPLVGEQPPLAGTHLISALEYAGRDLLPGISFEWGDYRGNPIDLEIRLGDTVSTGLARRSIAIGARRWAGTVSAVGTSWPPLDWTFGGLAAAGLGSVEAFKESMRKLNVYAARPENFETLFAPFGHGAFSLVDEDMPDVVQLERFDIVSAGAIANAFLYCLARIRDARGRGRAIDFDAGDLSNLNRNMLLLRSRVPELKVNVLAASLSGDLTIEPLPVRFDEQHFARIAPLARHVVVGADDIPTRWGVQARRPQWLGIGATTHWSSMASFHNADTACARCLHPADEPNNGPIPTVAFVSFWAGLMLAVYLLESLVNRSNRHRQQTFLTPLHSETVWRTPVSRRLGCPLCGH